MTRRVHFLICAGVLAFGFQLSADRIPNRYIVEFKTPAVAQQLGRRLAREGGRGAAANAHRGRVRAEQQQARQRLAAGASVLDSVDTVANALFVEIPDARVSELRSLPNVVSVHPMRTFHRVLDRAVEVNKVVDAWNQVGVERAGAGIKIAIIDSGIDAFHAAFQDPSLSIPESFPKLTYASDQIYTNHKVIVARSYVNLLPYRDPDRSSRDRVGHGTALAMVSAGVRNAGPRATIQGVAPTAWLGNYKVFGTPGYNDSTTDAAILKAIDDAVADGMDVINLSIGDDFAPRLEDDVEVQAIEAATKAGVIVVVAAGNNGPGLNTLGSPATAPSALAVGASRNGRTFAASVEVEGLASFVAVPDDGATPSSVISGPLADAAAFDETGLGCGAYPSDSLAGRIALIQRGTCTFESKLANAQSAGAVGAIIYAAATSPDPFTMSVGSASLPAEMVSYSDGSTLKQALAGGATLNATLRFTVGSVDTDYTRLSGFSAAGPGVDYSIKPDLVAVGSDVYVATQTLDRNGDMYDATGYKLVNGTSFSTPLVAGAAALLKNARPGLSVEQYRSLLINNTTNLNDLPGEPSTIQQSGGGALNLWAALNAAVTVSPSTLGFGVGPASPELARNLTISNVSGTDAVFTITVVPSSGDPGPVTGTNTVQLAAGASTSVSVTWTGNGLSPGAHEGFLKITGAASGVETRVPYWYDVASGTPARITLLYNVDTARRGSMQQDALLFRILDSAGVPLTDAAPVITAVSGGGSVRTITSYDRDVPGVYGAALRLGIAAGPNIFRIQAGDATLEASITGQ